MKVRQKNIKNLFNTAVVFLLLLGFPLATFAFEAFQIAQLNPPQFIEPGVVVPPQQESPGEGTGSAASGSGSSGGSSSGGSSSGDGSGQSGPAGTGLGDGVDGVGAGTGNTGPGFVDSLTQTSTLGAVAAVANGQSPTIGSVANIAIGVAVALAVTGPVGLAVGVVAALAIAGINLACGGCLSATFSSLFGGTRGSGGDDTSSDPAANSESDPAVQGEIDANVDPTTGLSPSTGTLGPTATGPGNGPTGLADFGDIGPPGSHSFGNEGEGPAPSPDPDANASFDDGLGDGGGGGGCFTAGTLILMRMDGDTPVYKKIKDIKIGDYVLGVRFNTDGQPILATSKVLKLLSHEKKSYAFSELISSNGIKIVGTSNHVIIGNTKNQGVRLENMLPGQKIVSALRKTTWDNAESIKSLPDKVTAVFNFETETENYFVSEDGKGAILVHNGAGK